MRTAASWAAFVAFCAACVGVLDGCGPEAKGRAAEATYLAEHLRCIEEADTLAASKACRAAVDQRWGVDGGAK